LGEGCHASHQPSDASTPTVWLSQTQSGVSLCHRFTSAVHRRTVEFLNHSKRI